MKYLKIFLFSFCFMLAAPQVYSQKDKQKELEAKRKAILEEIKQINSLLSKTRTQEKSVLSQVEDINTKIAATENLIRVTNQQANLLTRNINSNIDKISTLQEELKVMKEDYAEMVRKSYKSKNQQSRVMFLLSSESFLQAYKRVQYMKQYAAYRKRQGEEINLKTKELQRLNDDLMAQKKEKQKLIDENNVAKNQLLKERQAQQELVATLKKNESTYTAQIRTKQKEADKIDREIDALIRAAIEEANRKAAAAAGSKKTPTAPAASGGFALTAEDKALAASFSSNKGKLPWPVERGMVVKSFGTHRHPQFPNVTTSSSGVEIATEDLAPVRAVFDGTVMSIQKIKGAHITLFIQHGDYITVYSNLETVSVKKGDKVTTKQQIGTVAQSPTAGRTILKFYIYRNNVKINPAEWIYRM
ncbi:MAG TPA: peptidoglycan DD-metalloendopeptidase family protein [Flavobacteriaceae bacterium]|nr:peptidoglycan DD-metalloendopeptidase family protein [Flavobacteriaceae bacterium]